MSVENNEMSTRRPLRLWPGVAIVVVQWLLRFVVPGVMPERMGPAMLGTIACGLLLILWWLFFSRAPWSERLGALAFMAAAVALSYPLLDKSIANGAMGMLPVILTLPLLCLVLVAWAATTGRASRGPRWAMLVVGVALVCGYWMFFRTGGLSSVFGHEFAWRWSETPEDRLLAETSEEPMAPLPAAVAQPAEPEAPVAVVTSEAAATTAQEPTAAVPSSETEPPATAPAMDGEAAAPSAVAPAAAKTAAPAEWPGFRGAARDGVVHGVRIATDWSASPPVEMWRRPVGPGWSSFAVEGDVFFTQEQRGEEEIVSCYRLRDGEPVWRHADPVRFWESNAGAGPRATPTLHGNHVIALGATGVLNVLNAVDGSVVWSRNPAEEHDVETPGWGFSGSPLVVGDVVIAPLSGRLAAYDLATGTPRWTTPSNGGGYSSPQLVTLAGVPQVVFQRGKATVSVAPTDGTVLWEHTFPSVSIVQPALTADGDLLLTDNDGGTSRFAVTHGAEWTLEERWTSIGLKPYFSDFVVHEGHVYGIDGNMLASIDVTDGKKTWKGGRYGSGQMVLLADQDLLLVISEKGELALVSATPTEFKELARMPAITGKTWNHPVVVGDVLLVRNDREMAAFRLAREGV